MLLDPATAAVNVVDCPPGRDAVDGDTLTEIVGTSEMLAVSVLVESAALVAFTVTVWAEVMVEGAV